MADIWQLRHHWGQHKMFQSSVKDYTLIVKSKYFILDTNYTVPKYQMHHQKYHTSKFCGIKNFKYLVWMQAKHGLDIFSLYISNKR